MSTFDWQQRVAARGLKIVAHLPAWLYGRQFLIDYFMIVLIVRSLSKGGDT